ncbi:hypothetical protein BVC80_1305g8 [Macleaya cordata]|uniref:Uncharacterized protein n=1 Tax=Macleaya cordata TaxID=56857 RepID=A0A200R3C2_MACCD|nr:hypothetical protein BVC80_1305g8 [Macleaya cordata]
MGDGVSKTAIRALAPSREIARKEKHHNEIMKNKMDSIEKAYEEQSRAQKGLQEEVAALKEMLQSTPRSSHQSSESGSTSQMYASSFESPSDLPSKNCLLRNLRKKIVALGRINTDAAPAVETYNIIVDAIYDNNEYLCDREEKFGDIMVGDLINWPKAFVEFLR